MAEFVLERVIHAAPDRVFAAALNPELHVRSMASHGETMVAGPRGEAFAEGDSATWRARHFGIRFHLTSVVFDIDPPRRFCDSQTKGPFGAFHHEHVFLEHPEGTLMRDTVTFRSPFGPLGRLVDRLIMRNHLRRVIAERNDVLARTLEG